MQYFVVHKFSCQDRILQCTVEQISRDADRRTVGRKCRRTCSKTESSSGLSRGLHPFAQDRVQQRFAELIFQTLAVSALPVGIVFIALLQHADTRCDRSCRPERLAWTRNASNIIHVDFGSEQLWVLRRVAVQGVNTTVIELTLVASPLLASNASVTRKCCSNQVFSQRNPRHTFPEQHKCDVNVRKNLYVRTHDGHHNGCWC